MPPGAHAQAGRVTSARAMLRLFTLVAIRCLQGSAHSLAIPAILRRPPRLFLRNDVRHFPSALFDEYVSLLASGSAFPLRSTQWRNQHDCFQSALAACEGTADPR